MALEQVVEECGAGILSFRCAVSPWRQARLRLAIQRQLAREPGSRLGVQSGGWNSSKQFHQHEGEGARWLVEAFESAAAATVEEMWANVLPIGAWVDFHSHHQFDLAGLFYLHDHPVRTCFQTELGCITVTPRRGFLLVFPGTMQHCVLPNQGPTRRLTIACNLRRRHRS